MDNGLKDKTPLAHMKGKGKKSKGSAPGYTTRHRESGTATPQMEIPPINKRARPAEIGGLKTNWKKAVIIPDARGRSSTSANARARSSSRSAMRTGTSSKGDYGGTFADDEPDSTIQAAQALKPSGSASRSSGTARISWKWIPALKFVTLKTLFGGLENDTKVRTRRLSARVMEEEERLMEALANPAEDDVPDNGLQLFAELRARPIFFPF
ncbi:hypothetical protein B0H10DRAFT_2223836 [Mycena sp. CBHHK59/15]|nr:hypothetical protein B0H10DRAFT_2223836 [Mycena sp. CBHHK59/15]